MIGKKVKVGILVAVISVFLVLAIVFFPKIIGLSGLMLRLFMPFILGYLFSLLANPLADLLERRFRLPRTASAILVLLILVGVIGGILTGIISKIVQEIKNVIDNFPAIYVNALNMWEEVSDKLSNIYDVMPTAVKNALSGVGENVRESLKGLTELEYAPIFTSAKNIAKKVPSIFISSIVFILASFFMISDAKRIKNVFSKVNTGAFRERLGKAKVEIKRYVGGYIKAQLIIMSFSFVILFIGLNILDIEYSLLIAIGTAFLDALPFFGTGAVLWPWAVISFITGEIGVGVGMIIIYLAVIFTRQMIEPKIVSKNIGMNPILTLMSMYIGFKLFSLGGMILGPLTLMFFISLKRAGFFDGIIELLSLLRAMIKKEYNTLKNQFKE